MRIPEEAPRLGPMRPIVAAVCVLWMMLCPLRVDGAAHSSVNSADSTLLVLAAASLADALQPVADAWRAEGGRPVRFSFSATSRAAVQAAEDVTADVIVSADRAWMTWLEGRARVETGAAVLVASNELVIVVPAGTRGITSPADLATAGRLALAGESVPAGRYAREALETMGYWEAVAPHVVRGGSVRGALEWVARGEVASGVVYRTDALSESRVETAFTFDPSVHTPIGYWAAPLEGSDAPEQAAAFVGFLASDRGSSLLRDAGFGSPDGSPSAALSDLQRLPTTPSQDGTRTDISGSSGSSGGPSVTSAIRLSVIVALLATLLGLVPAVGLGWLLARHEFPGKALVSTIVMAPLVMPPVVTGFLLLSLLGASTPLGGALASLGLPVPFTLVGAALAALVVGMPLYVISIRNAFEAIDSRYEELSMTLGATPRKTFFEISLPLALPGIAAGAVLAFARSLGEFGATVVLAGNVEGSTRTIALAVYTLLESPSGESEVWVLVGASVIVSLVALFGFEVLSRRQKHRLEDRHGR